jgi:uncharacterized phage-associated protein
MWKSHIECTRAVAEDLNISGEIKEELIESAIYPDTVKKSQEKVCGVKLNTPHHKDINSRIIILFEKLKTRINKNESISAFAVGCLLHFIQDSVIYGKDSTSHRILERKISNCTLNTEYQSESIYSDNYSNIEINDILIHKTSDSPEDILNEGYLKSKIILKLLFNDQLTLLEREKENKLFRAVLKAWKKGLDATESYELFLELRKVNIDNKGECTLKEYEDWFMCLTSSDLRRLFTTILGVGSIRVRPIIYESYRRGYLTDEMLKKAGYKPENAGITNNKCIAPSIFYHSARACMAFLEL